MAVGLVIDPSSEDERIQVNMDQQNRGEHDQLSIGVTIDSALYQVVLTVHATSKFVVDQTIVDPISAVDRIRRKESLLETLVNAVDTWSKSQHLLNDES